MAVKGDIKNIINGFKISNHKFVNELSNGLQKTITNKVSELEMIPEGRKESGSTISLRLVGQTYTEDPEQTQKRINDVMQKLRNANILISLIK